MRSDQFDRLQALHVDLTEKFLEEAEPSSWPGAGMKISEMSKQQRGDAFWCKKNAVATIALMQRISSLVDHVRWVNSQGDDNNPDAVTEPQEDLDAEVNAAEKEATRLLAGVQTRARAALHGKA